MTLGLYFDKSGPTDEIPAVTVAGFISTVEKWTALTEEWERALHTFDRFEKGTIILGLPHFHMTDYDSGRGWYEDWQARGVKRERFAQLLDIIERHVMGVVCVSVSVADCKGWSIDPPVEVGFNLAGSHCMNVIPRFATSWSDRASRSYMSSRRVTRGMGSWKRSRTGCSRPHGVVNTTA